MPRPEQLANLARQAEPNTRKLFNRLKKTKAPQLDAIVHALHEEVFERTDCLTCANCCKTTSPIFTDKDISRIASHMRIKDAAFIQQYLHIDEDGDYVLNVAPCPFLGTDNYCNIYAQRPNACREYPHTNRKRFYQILDLSIRNTYICPATYEIIELLKKQL